MSRWTSLATVLLAACTTNDYVAPPGGGSLPPPSNLFYEVTSGGPATIPVATLLEWDQVNDGSVNVWNVYSRSNTTQRFLLRGTTTSNSFHDQGVPELQYYVTAVDYNGFESLGSNIVTDRRAADAAARRAAVLDQPRWGGGPRVVGQSVRERSPGVPQLPRVQYAVQPRHRCLPARRMGGRGHDRGTRVHRRCAPERPAALLRGVGGDHRGLREPLVADRDRYAASRCAQRRDQCDAVQRGVQSGFRFWRDQNADGQVQDQELGLILPGASPDADFTIERDGLGQLWLTPARLQASVAVYSGGPIADLTSIDFAPVGGYSHSPVQLQPGYGYVMEISGSPDGFLRYGALRATHVGRDFAIIDWSYQTDPGNPQLIRVR